MLVDGKNISQGIPVDYAITGLVTIAYKTATAVNKPVSIPVYNITAPRDKQMKWEECLEHGRKLYQEFPCSAGLWYPGGSITTNKLAHKFNHIMFMWLPAYLIDFLLFCFGQKRFMIRVQERIATGLDVLQFFTMRPWDFKADNYLSLWNELSPEDKQEFLMDFSIMENYEYLKICLFGGRQYILKESLDTLPRARMQMKIQWALDIFCKTFFIGLFIYWILKAVGALDVIYNVVGVK